MHCVYIPQMRTTAKLTKCVSRLAVFRFKDYAFDLYQYSVKQQYLFYRFALTTVETFLNIVT